MSCLTFLGIKLGTVTLQLRLPNDKLIGLKAALATAQSKKSMSNQNLQSLTYLLWHAAKVISPGRPDAVKYQLEIQVTCISKLLLWK